MKIAATLVLCLMANPVFAGSCDSWTASMQEDEGGPRMTAAICAQASSSTPDAQHDLFVQCAGSDGIEMRFLPFAPDSYPPGGNEEFKTKIAVSMDQDTFTLDAHYEAMDAAMVMVTDAKSPFVGALMSRRRMSFTDVDGKVPGATFTLKDSRGAFEKLLATCKN